MRSSEWKEEEKGKKVKSARAPARPCTLANLSTNRKNISIRSMSQTRIENIQNMKIYLILRLGSLLSLIVRVGLAYALTS